MDSNLSYVDISIKTYKSWDLQLKLSFVLIFSAF